MTVEQELRALRNFYDMTLPELIAEAFGKKIKVILE